MTETGYGRYGSRAGKVCRDNTPLPLIAAGGIGSKNFFDGFQSGADAIGVGIFHWVGESIVGIKSFLKSGNQREVA